MERPQAGETLWAKFQGLDAVEARVCWVDGFLPELSSKANLSSGFCSAPGEAQAVIVLPHCLRLPQKAPRTVAPLQSRQWGGILASCLWASQSSQ